MSHDHGNSGFAKAPLIPHICCVATSLACQINRKVSYTVKELDIATLTGSKTPQPKRADSHMHLYNPLAYRDVLETGSMTAQKLDCCANSLSAAHRQCCSCCQHSLCCTSPRLQRPIQCCSVSVISAHEKAVGQIHCSTQVCWGRLELQRPHQYCF